MSHLKHQIKMEAFLPGTHSKAHQDTNDPHTHYKHHISSRCKIMCGSMDYLPLKWWKTYEYVYHWCLGVLCWVPGRKTSIWIWCCKWDILPHCEWVFLSFNHLTQVVAREYFIVKCFISLLTNMKNHWQKICTFCTPVLTS